MNAYQDFSVDFLYKLV